MAGREKGSRGQSQRSVMNLVVTALFAALVYVGTTFIQIPIPGSTNFIHFGNVFLMLSVLLLEPVYGVTGPLLAYFLSDLMLGRFAGIPKILLLSFVKAIIPALLFPRLKKRMPQVPAIVLSCLPGFLAYIILDIVVKSVTLTLLGATAGAAFVGAIVDQFAAVCNMGVALVVVPLLYPILHKVMTAAGLRPRID